MAFYRAKPPFPSLKQEILEKVKKILRINTAPSSCQGQGQGEGQRKGNSVGSQDTYPHSDFAVCQSLQPKVAKKTKLVEKQKLI
jgi:hypothetical protein